MRIHQRSFTATLAGITVMAVLALPLQAQETTSSGTLNLAQRYPVGSIKSVKNANQALKDVKRQRNFIQKRYKKEERTCYHEHFFANHCRSEARKRYRAALHETDRVRIEAKRFKRHAALAKRDEAAKERQQEKIRLIQIPGHNADKTNRHATLSAQERAENEAAYARKLKRYEARKREVADKKAARKNP